MNFTTESTHSEDAVPNDNETIGSYVEHDPTDPVWPCGLYEDNYVLAHIPKVVTLTYGQIMNHLASGFVLDLSVEALDKLRDRFEKDPRFAEYRLDELGGDPSILVTLERNNSAKTKDA